MNKQGEILWTAYSDKGDVDHGATHIAATPDGGVVMALKVRAWVEEAGLRNLLEYVNPDGVGYSVTDFANQKGEYKYLIVKIDSDGNIIWCRIISGEVKTDTKYATKNNAYINGLALDEVGNIFLAGNFRTSLTFLMMILLQQLRWRQRIQAIGMVTHRLLWAICSWCSLIQMVFTRKACLLMVQQSVLSSTK